jgi:hypothetical protein|tara:strand:+ start:3044 stop:3364 length:321 start_codon:yes stop_codon:yes gene_type:complete
MAFKLKPFYNIDTTPIYAVELEEGVTAKANNNGSILIDKNISDSKEIASAISHEKVHLDQMERGDLGYDTHNVYWKGKTYSRSNMLEGAKDLPWEKEAYKKQTKNK